MEDLKPVIANNLVLLRKSMNWTQAELAQKLNYSDKAVSKWERGESLPDVTVLKELGDLFHVTVDYLLEAEHGKPGTSVQGAAHFIKRNRLIITLLGACFVILIATILFVALQLYSLQHAARIWPPSWMTFVYAIPAACIVLLVFNALWGRRKLNFAIISLLLWSLLLAAYLTFLGQGTWLIFVIGVPAQLIILLWANFKQRGGRIL
jgi:transcriptional regulator with XRE-family HTH domain